MAEIDCRSWVRVEGMGVAVAGSELPIGIVAPTPYVTRVEDRAGMLRSGDDRAHATPAAVKRGGKRITHLSGGIAVKRAGQRRSELGGRIVAPAFDLLMVEKRARESSAHR